MSDRAQRPGPPAVRLGGVSKIYRLYQKPLYRLLDLLGLCPSGRSYYVEHEALARIDLSVAGGEKVAIIGRNGAGKSTLLKVITGLIQPSAGSVEVNGRISNLLQIGSGFHPDFTGRQNVFASLAHQGIVGRDARARFDEIVEFSEIEEYIDQPMKTYSTGMCSRLMFSASIVLKPELLLVDEILGVGDAYFAHKSFERMRSLCSQDGATLLLVTHDIYGAQNLCDRFIWIDRGAVKYDGDAGTAVAMYETSVKEQEEEARRRRAVKAVEVAAPSASTVTVVVRSQTGFALDRPLALSLIELRRGDGSVDRLDLASDTPSSTSWHQVAEGNLGPIQTLDGRSCRVLRPFGSIYHKAEWIVTVPAADGTGLSGARVQWRYDGADAPEFAVLSAARTPLIRGTLDGLGVWREAVFDAAFALQAGEAVQTEYGSALVRIADTRLLDAHGCEVTSVKHGDPLVVRLWLDVAEPAAGREVTCVLAFTRHGTSYAVNVVDHQLPLPDSPGAVVDVTLPAVRLGSGKWFLRVGIGEGGMFKHGTLGYFAVDARWYHLMRQGIAVDVQSVDQLDSAGCFTVHDGSFAVCAALESPDTSRAGEPAARAPRAPVAFDTRLREKWREIPATRQERMFSTDLLAVSDAALLEYWDHCRLETCTPEVRGWYQDLYKTRLANAAVADIGPGIGLDGIWFAQHGARVTFVDIVDDNLSLLRRVCRLKGVEADFYYIDNFFEYRFAGPFDCLLCVGSLINTPLDFAKRQVRALAPYLRVGGLVLMLGYPRERFEESGARDGAAFAAMTDGPRTPWIEWYDDDKVRELFGPGFRLEWSRNFGASGTEFNWFELTKVADGGR